MSDDFTAAVAKGRQAASELATNIWTDLDAGPAGGVGWWQYEASLSLDEAASMADYLVGIADTIPQILEEMSLARLQFEEQSTSWDMWASQRMREAGGTFPDLRSRNKQESRRDVAMRMSQTSLYVGAASLMDTLAGVTVGVLGLAIPLLKADARALGLTAELNHDYPWNLPPSQTRALLSKGTPGGDLQALTLRSIRASVDQAGPTDWWAWTDDMRNVRAHQGRRINWNVPKPKSLPGAMALLSPRQPRDMDMSSLRAGTKLFETQLAEDARDTHAGIVGSVNAATEGACAALLEAWRRRRDDPHLILQPGKQRETPPDRLSFPGYAETALPLPKAKDVVVAVSPQLGQRLRAGRVMDK